MHFNHSVPQDTPVSHSKHDSEYTQHHLPCTCTVIDRQTHSSIHCTHPDSFGIFTKLNTSMCAADCSQCNKFIYITPAALSHCLWQREINNSEKKSEASTSQVERLVLLSGLLHG